MSESFEPTMIGLSAIALTVGLSAGVHQCQESLSQSHPPTNTSSITPDAKTFSTCTTTNAPACCTQTCPSKEEYEKCLAEQVQHQISAYICAIIQ